MSEKIVRLNEEVIKVELKELVRTSVEEMLNGLLEQEAQQLTNVARYERSAQRQGYRSGHYSRNLTTTSGEVELKVPSSKAYPLKRLSLSGIAAVKAAWRKRSLKCTWQECLSAG